LNGLNVTDVVWEAKDPSVVTVTANGSRAALVLGGKIGGQTYVVGTYSYFGGVARDSALVTVRSGETSQVSRITLDPILDSVTVGQPMQYRVHYFNTSGREINAEVGSTTTFTVDNSQVAQVGSTTGLVTTRGEGSTKVNASYRVDYYPANQSLSAPAATLLAKK
jgi:hypothetical protein